MKISKRMRTVAIICASVLVSIILIVFFVYPFIKEIDDDNACIIRMRELYSVALDSDTHRGSVYLYPNLDYHRKGKSYISEIALCPACQKPYVYQPFNGPTDIKGDRIIAWCPEPCHRGKRRVLLENGQWELVSEDDFQKIVNSGEMKLSSANLKSTKTDTFMPP